MWEKIFDLISKVFTLTTRIDKHDEEIKELKTGFADLNKRFTELAVIVGKIAQRQESDREYIQIWIQNEMANLERRLPASSEKDNEK